MEANPEGTYALTYIHYATEKPSHPAMRLRLAGPFLSLPTSFGKINPFNNLPSQKLRMGVHHRSIFVYPGSSESSYTRAPTPLD